jgi:signal transduction histidine kinase
MRLNSLAFRLFATAAVWTLLVLPVAGAIIYSLYREDVQESFDAELKKLVAAISVDSMGGDEPIAPTNRFEPLFEVTYSGWYWQIKPLDPAGGAQLVSASLATSSLPSPLENGVSADATGTRWMNVDGPKGEPIRIAEVIDTLGHERGAQRYSVIVAGPLDWLEDRIEKFRNRLTIALTLAGIGLVSVTLFQVRFGLLPLRKIERGLAAVRSGEAQKLEGDLPAEIKPLQVELNALIQSNQDIVDRARTQVGNLAHALKTPLAVITNEAREEKSAFGQKVAEQAQIMRDQVGHYLDRARMAAGAAVIGRVTQVEPVVEPLVRALERIHGEKNVQITAACQPGARFKGEKQDFEEMLGNLLDNACKWARAKVLLTVEQSSPERAQPRRLVVTVEDDGQGLTPEQMARIGKRGLRLDETQPGSGLGLSIVADLVHSYRGRLDLASSPHGGLLVRLELPAA